MHILTVSDYLNNLGGAEISARTIVNGLLQHEDVSEITVLGIDLTNEEQLNYGTARLCPVRLPSVADYLPDLLADKLVARLLSRRIEQLEEDVDIIHAHHKRAARAVAETNVSVPTVATIRDYWPICPISIYTIGAKECNGCNSCLDNCLEHQGWDDITETVRRQYLNKKRKEHRRILSFDGTVFISNHVEQTIVSNTNITGETEVIYNPVEIGSIGEAPNQDTPEIVTASRLAEVKGVSTVIKSLDIVANSYPCVKLTIFGDGPLRSELQDLTAKYGLKENVEFRGRCPSNKVYQAMKRSSATVFPSLWQEPLGRITIESMMIGSPVIGSNVGGISEVIKPRENGLLFPPGDYKALADRICYLLNDETNRIRMGREGQEFAKKFTKEAVAAEYVEFYHRLYN